MWQLRKKKKRDSTAGLAVRGHLKIKKKGAELLRVSCIIFFFALSKEQVFSYSIARSIIPVRDAFPASRVFQEHICTH